MKHREEIKIFLASPSDVPTERRYVKRIAEELNRHIAADHGVFLEVVSSERARPGYGKDGQSIVNEQIARMSNYDLFIAIMWKRIGTPTPRAVSGTVEEYTRARSSFKRTGRPEIWFYFREPVVEFNSDEAAAQQKAVLRFRGRIRTKGLFRDYKTPAEFAQQLRDHLTQWLIERKRRRKRSPKGPPVGKAQVGKKPVVAKPRGRPSRSDESQSAKGIEGPGPWIMLNNSFFKTVSAPIRSGKNITLRISITGREKAAELRALDPADSHRRKQVIYVDNIDANYMEVNSVSIESSGKSMIFHLELVAVPRMQNHNLLSFATYSNYTAQEVATIHARMLLLGELLPQDQGTWFPQLYLDNQERGSAIQGSIFPPLWESLKVPASEFLPKAWLQALYYLRMTNIIDDIHELKLGPIKNKVMPVRLKGIRNQLGTNQKPLILEVIGNCVLS